MVLLKKELIRVLEETKLNIQLLSEQNEISCTLTNSVELITNAYRNGKKVILCGNGGSAADAQHIAAEFMGRFLIERPPLSAIPLTVNSSAVTAIGNDYSFNAVFSRQLSGLGKEGDVFIGISTSGNSQNICEALVVARQMGIGTISLTGASGGAMKELSDICIAVPSTSTPRIQEMQILLGHFICEMVEKEMYG